MTVIVAVRNPKECRETVEKTIKLSSTKGEVLYERCDLADMESVEKFAMKIKLKFSTINLLINNGKVLQINKC